MTLHTLCSTIYIHIYIHIYIATSGHKRSTSLKILKLLRSKKNRPNIYVMTKKMHLSCNSCILAHDICASYEARIFFAVYKNLSPNLHIYTLYIYLYLYMYIIVRKVVPVPPFLRHTPLDPACPPFLKSLFPLNSFLFHPVLRYFRWFSPPSRNPLQP